MVVKRKQHPIARREHIGVVWNGDDKGVAGAVVKLRSSMSVDMSSECVTEPVLMNVRRVMLAASSIVIVKVSCRCSMECGASLITGRVAKDPSELNR